MMVSHNFLFIAGEPALDFVNTEIVRDGERVDLLDGPDALEQWMRDAGLGRVRVTAAALKAAKRLRAALRRFAAGERSPLRAINEEFQRAAGALVLRAKDGKFEIAFEPREDDARFLLARAAANLVANADPSRIRACEGTNCILFFYDTTKSGTRRWCSMAGCGNRMKAAAHYRRKGGRMKDEG